MPAQALTKRQQGKPTALSLRFDSAMSSSRCYDFFLHEEARCLHRRRDDTGEEQGAKHAVAAHAGTDVLVYVEYAAIKGSWFGMRKWSLTMRLGKTERIDTISLSTVVLFAFSTT